MSVYSVERRRLIWCVVDEVGNVLSTHNTYDAAAVSANIVNKALRLSLTPPPSDRGKPVDSDNVTRGDTVTWCGEIGVVTEVGSEAATVRFASNRLRHVLLSALRHIPISDGGIADER